MAGWQRRACPGMIIFFDWADESGQDGLSDHTGIVQKVENGKVYTVEGNSGDSCRVNEYSIGYYEILGYGALPIKIHKPPAFCRRLDYISERYCAGLKTKSLKIQT